MTPDPTELARVLEECDELGKSALGARYQLALGDASRVIRELAADFEWAIDSALSQGGIGGDAEDIARANAAREKWRLE